MFVVARRFCNKGGVPLVASCRSAFLCSIRSYQNDSQREEYIIGSPARIRKLVAAQPDALLAKEIFDLTSRHYNVCHSYPTYVVLIIKLGRSRHYRMMDSVLSSLRRTQYEISPSLFSHIIKIYGEAGLPDKARETFYTILKFKMKPTTKHLNQILEILVSDRNFMKPAFDLLIEAQSNGVCPNTNSYNILMRAFCLNNKLCVAYTLFNNMFKRDVLPDVETYKIMVQGFCRKSQVNTAVKLMEDMLNKGYVPDSLSYTTLLNSLCRKRKLREAYKILSRMKVHACNPDIVHYNTVIQGFCRERRAQDAIKILHDMPLNGCSPNVVSYRTLVTGLCNQGRYVEAKVYIDAMLSKGFSPHRTVVHLLVRGFCSTGLIDEACEVLENALQHGEMPLAETWLEVISRVCVADDSEGINNIFKEVMKINIKPYTRNL